MAGQNQNKITRRPKPDEERMGRMWDNMIEQRKLPSTVKRGIDPKILQERAKKAMETMRFATAKAMSVFAKDWVASKNPRNPPSPARIAERLEITGINTLASRWKVRPSLVPFFIRIFIAAEMERQRGKKIQFTLGNAPEDIGEKGLKPFRVELPQSKNAAVRPRGLVLALIDINEIHDIIERMNPKNVKNASRLREIDAVVGRAHKKFNNAGISINSLTVRNMVADVLEKALKEREAKRGKPTKK